MGFFDDEIEQVTAARTASAESDRFWSLYRAGFEPASSVADEYVPIIKDFVHRIPVSAGRPANWLLDPEGKSFFFEIPSPPSKPALLEGKTRTRDEWNSYQARAKAMRDGGRPALLLTIWLDQILDGEYEAAVFARKSDGPWIAVQSRPSSLLAGVTLWSQPGTSGRVVARLTRWLMEGK